MAYDNSKSSGDSLLREIRDQHTYFSAEWKDHRAERATDLRYLSGDPWEEKERKARADNGRPTINHDELNQYVNQAINNLRQNKRGIKINPAGNGATDKTAEFHENLIRAIEYRSQAQSCAYIPAAESQIAGSYGFYRVSRRFADERSFNQELRLIGIPNPDSVLYDPDCKMADGSDARTVFVLEPIPEAEFARKYPKAKKISFSGEDKRVAPDWIGEKTILVAEYWKARSTQKRLLLIKHPSAGFVAVYEDEMQSGEAIRSGMLPDTKGISIARARMVEVRSIVQYLTNGVEILSESTEPEGCQYIPVVPVYGKELYVDTGSGAKRKLLSLVRLARDPQMSLAYLVSQQMEEAGLTPKVPWIGYVGQFETDAEAWETAHKIPHAMLKADPIVDASNGQVLPLPTRNSFTPNFQQYEIAKDSCRRAIQAAMGIMPLPTAAQRSNQKSGVALEKIQTQQSVGSFHFLDNLDRALQFGGRILLERIPAVYDTEQEVGLMKADQTPYTAQINTAEPVQPEGGEAYHIKVGEGDHDITISTGPSFESQREAADDFLNTLMANLGNLPIPPPAQAKLLSLAIQEKNLGPRGDQMAEIIAPPDPNNLSPQAQAALQHAQGTIQQLQQQLQQAGQIIQTKQVENQGKAELEQIKGQFEMSLQKMKFEHDLAVAEIQTKAQIPLERMKFIEDLWAQFHGQAHEAGMAAQEQAHQQQMAAAQAQQQTDAQQADQAHQQQMAQQAQAAPDAQAAQSSQ